MLAYVIMGTIFFIVGLVIYSEYQNEKRYREERRKRETKKGTHKRVEPKISSRPAANKEPKETPQTAKQEKPTEPLSPKPVESAKTVTPPKSESASVKTEVKPAPEPQKPATQLPKGDYPDFNYNRLIEMGLSEEEALEFIQELIPQIGDQIPLIDEAMKIPDFHKMERLTHSIKGSSTTIGTGGVSDLLVDYNTYLKTGEELPVAEAYQEHLKRYFEKLKKQFPPKK